MIRIFFGVFLALHGLVHLLYFGQSARYFELQPGMIWPDGSWVFARLLGTAMNRNLAGALLILAAAIFVAAGAGVLLKQAWWQGALVAAAVLSGAIYILFWDGAMQSLDNKGGVGILINLALLVSVFVFHWPNLEF